MTRRQLTTLARQSPNWTVTDPSAFLPGCNVVQRVSIAIIVLKAAFGVVNADRPETINRYILDCQLVNVLPSFFEGTRLRLKSAFFRIVAPLSSQGSLGQSGRPIRRSADRIVGNCVVENDIDRVNKRLSGGIGASVSG